MGKGGEYERREGCNASIRVKFVIQEIMLGWGRLRMQLIYGSVGTTRQSK